jgi:hypothetical protein
VSLAGNRRGPYPYVRVSLKPPFAKWGCTLNLLWAVVVVLVVLWLFGFAMHVGGGLIHLLLVVALVVVVVRLISGRGV